MAETQTQGRCAQGLQRMRSYIGHYAFQPQMPTTIEMPLMAHQVLPGISAKIQETLVEGELRHHGKWKTQSVRMHLFRSFRHAMLWMVGNKKEDHLGHSAVRFLMALELLIARRAGNQPIRPPSV